MISRMSGKTNAALYSVAYQFAVVLVLLLTLSIVHLFLGHTEVLKIKNII